MSARSRQVVAAPPGRFHRIRIAAARLVRWWNALQAVERILYRALGLLAIGFALTPLPALAFIVPGAILTLVFFGFSLRRGS
jgi:hypothetical protein